MLFMKIHQKQSSKVLGGKMGINASLQKGKAIYFPSFFYYLFEE